MGNQLELSTQVPLAQMFRRWDATRPPEAETIIPGLASDIRSDCRTIQSKLEELKEGNGMYTLKHPSGISFYMRENSLIAANRQAALDWRIRMSLTPISAFISIVRFNPKKVYRLERNDYSLAISESAKGPITCQTQYAWNYLVKPQEYRDILRTTSVLRSAIGA